MNHIGLILIVTLPIIAIAFLAMAVRIIFHRSHKFPETSAGHNPEMRKRGINCPRIEEAKLHSGACSTCYGTARKAVEEG